MTRFELSELQADAVLETKLYRLGKLEIRDILNELAQKRKRAKEIQQLLKDEPARWEMIRGELKQIVADLRRAAADADRGAARPRWNSARKTTSSTKMPG